jgi:hypothetical protein
MKQLKSIVAYSWAIMTIPFFFGVFVFSDVIYQNLFEKNKVKIADRISGGRVMHTIKRNDYFINLYNPVFDGFFYKRKTGFIQVDFMSETELPESIEENIDYNFDKVDDFFISINTQSNTYELIPKTKKVKRLSQEGMYVLEKRRTIRVLLKR